MYRANPADGIAWVTGASSGIGRALTLRLADGGFHVAATARRADALATLVEDGQGRITAFPGDVTDGGGMRGVVAGIEKTLGPIALAVLNAGVYDLRERERFDADLSWYTIETNLGGTLRCLDPLLATMIRRGRGQIAIVASLAGYGGIPGSLAYGASKSALISVAEALRLTYTADSLTVQVINPGFVDTDMTKPNDYPMPLMMSSETAAQLIMAGLKTGGFEITFPKRLAFAIKAARVLPYSLWLLLMRYATRHVGTGTSSSVELDQSKVD